MSNFPIRCKLFSLFLRIFVKLANEIKKEIMKKNLSKITVVVLLAFVLVGTFSLTSCKKKVAPELPPEGAFVMADLSGDTTSKGLYGNFGYAALNVAVWTTITNVGMAVPVAAYKMALTQEPVHVSGNKWVWEYQVGVGLVIVKTYTVQLYGETFDDRVEWELHVSFNGEFDDFIWYTGTHNIEATAGEWIIYKSPSENHEFVKVDWTRNKDDGTGTIKYTNIEPENVENGGYIYYGNDQDGTFNSFFDIFNKGDNNLIEIDYNTHTHVGRVKSEFWFFDENWHCWNEQFRDDFCGETTK